MIVYQPIDPALPTHKEACTKYKKECAEIDERIEIR
jgi:hypothetical protein